MDLDQEYQESLDFIYSFIDLSVTRHLRYSPEKFNIARMYKLMSLMGDPHLSYDVVHVAGTKGKGSICAMTASILQEAGYKVGFYSSPHMIDFRERIKVNNIDIPKEAFIDYIKKYRPIFLGIDNVSTFEIITAIAFIYFSDLGIDIAVVEVGMGGRLDATNVVNPILSVISSISHDHTKILGNTLPEIAREKAGIIKKNTPVIISSQKRSVKNEIVKIANEHEAQLIDISEIYAYEQINFYLEKQTFRLKQKTENTILPDELLIELQLVGDHQIQNAITTFAGITQLNKLGYIISKTAIQHGFSNAKWRGRFEIIREKPLVIIDGAHNLDSFRKLRDTIEKYLPNKNISLIFGVSEDKNIVSMIKAVQPYITDYIFTKTKHPRAMEISDLETIAKKLKLKKYSTIKIEDIIPLLLNKKENGSIYIASGSIFLAGAITQLLSDQEKLL